MEMLGMDSFGLEGRDRLSMADVDGVGEVEMLDPASGVYVRCFVHDVSVEKGYFVSVDGDVGSGEWVDRQCVLIRELSEEEDVMRPPEVGHRVEVKGNTSPEDNRVTWTLGRIVDEIDGFYHVSFTDGTDEVVEHERLREPSRRRPAEFVKEIVGVPEGVRQDILRTGHTLRELAQDLRLGELKVNETGETIEMVGPRDAMEDARQALSVHFLRVRRFARLSGIHQALAQRWQDVNNLRERALELSFEVNHDVIGSCIGKAGVNLKKAHRVPGVVSVKVTDFEGEDGTQRHRFNIVAKDKKAAETAREFLEYVRVRMFVTPEEIGPVIGKKGVHLREIEQKTGVSKFVLVEDPSMLSPPYFETVGTRKGVETAKRLFNMHRGYLVKNRQIEDDIRKLRTSLAQLGVSGDVTIDQLQKKVFELTDTTCPDKAAATASTAERKTVSKATKTTRTPHFNNPNLNSCSNNTKRSPTVPVSSSHPSKANRPHRTRAHPPVHPRTNNNNNTTSI